MAARKRASTQSKLLNRAVTAGRSALRQAQRRLPPDVRKQIDRTVKDGQKTIHTAIKQVETRLDRTARQADLEKAMKRLDELSQAGAQHGRGSRCIGHAGAQPAQRSLPPAGLRRAKPATTAQAPASAATAATSTRRLAGRRGAQPERARRHATGVRQPGSNGA